MGKFYVHTYEKLSFYAIKNEGLKNNIEVEAIGFRGRKIPDNISEDAIAILNMGIENKLFTEYQKTINRNAFLNNLRNKYVQHQKCTEQNLPIIPTYNKQNIQDLELFLNANENVKLIVAKPIIGSNGIGIEFVNKENFDPNDFDNTYIFQPYIEFESEWRVICIDNKAVSCFKKEKDYSVPSSKWLYPVNETNVVAKDLAQIAQVVLGIEYGGYDIGIDKNGKPYIIEINLLPTFEMSQIITGVNIASKIIEYIKRNYLK